MSVDGNLLVESYFSWMRGEVTAEVVDDSVVEFTAPFLGRHNDHIQFYVEEKSPGSYLLTDD